jgi:hydrogenase expression/formation protein HypE
MMLDEAAIPVKQEVEAACEFLGLDPLYVANEGKLVVHLRAGARRRAARRDARPSARRRGGDHRRVHADPHHFVQMTTGFGGKRIVDWLAGEQLPRIC